MDEGIPITLKVSNLSDFDLWVNQVELVVTEAEIVQPGTRIIVCDPFVTRQNEDDYKLYDALVILNGNRKELMIMKFTSKSSQQA